MCRLCHKILGCKTDADCEDLGKLCKNMGATDLGKCTGKLKPCVVYILLKLTRHKLEYSKNG